MYRVIENDLTNNALLLLLAPVSFIVLGLIALRSRILTTEEVKKSGNVIGVFGIVIALAFSILALINGSTQSSTLGIDELGFSIRLDSLSLTMFTMITILAAIIFKYSCTYLDGDAQQTRFLGLLATTISAVEILVIAGNLGLLVLAWIATSLSLHKLLTFYRDRPKALLAARKKFVVARLGDAFLIGAVVLLWQEFNTGDLGSIFSQIQSTSPLNPGWTFGTVDVAAIFLVAAAILKSAQFPTHGWLVEVMETPTPVSALLHAGILNAGPFLAIRMAYVLDTSRSAATLLIIIGGFTAAFASVAFLTQSSIKVMLGYSSAAHMGFSLLLCGMGLYPAAFLHLVGHSFYKAHCFLSSGSTIDEARAHGVQLPKRLCSIPRIIESAIFAIAIYVPFAAVWSFAFDTSATMIALGAIFMLGITQLMSPAIDSNGPIKGVYRTTLLALAVTTSFFTLEAITHKLLYSAIPEAINRDLFQLFLVGTIFAIFTLVIALQTIGAVQKQSESRRKLALAFRNGLYVNAYFDRFLGALRINNKNTINAEVAK